jgi:hypothetical protein
VRITGPHRRTPAAVAAALERGVPLPDGSGDRYAGYAILDVRFAGGDILALRRFPVASIGIGYTSVWHRSAEGEWTLFADVPRTQGCGRYFAGLFSHTVVAPIRIDWRGPRSLVVEVQGGQLLKWRLDLASSAATTVFNAAAGCLSPASRIVDLALKVSGLRLADHIPDGIRLHALPEAVWAVNASRARLRCRDLGCLRSDVGIPGRRIELWRPRRALFAAGALVIDAPMRSEFRSASQP